MTRNYLSIVDEYLVAALRLKADLLMGHVPFSTLPGVGGLSYHPGVGDARGVRGVPSNRYSGKIKVLGNFELRSIFWRFNIKSTRFGLGACAFFDAGRVWADFKHSELDGSGPGIKFGTGGGPQLLWGESLVIRFDVAYSPDASPVAFYIEAGRVF